AGGHRDEPRPATPGQARVRGDRHLLRRRCGAPGDHAPSPVLGRGHQTCPWYNTGVSTHDVDGLNAGYARALLDDYLENPEAVPSEWRALFESGESQLVATHPGIARLLELLPQAQGNGAGDGNGHTA